MPGSKRSSFNVYQSVTDSIVAAIEAGAGPIEMPWHSAGAALSLPENALTGKRYRGANVISLWAAAAAHGFSNPYWATYRQWRQLDAQVRRGEKGSVIVFYKKIDVDEPEDETSDAQKSTRLLARASWVFNADQVDGYMPPTRVAIDPVISVARADTFVTDTEVVIRHGGDSAFYSIVNDLIQMPHRSAFTGTAASTPTEGYYGVLFHELAHNAEIRIMPRLCRLPWSPLAEGRHHTA